jgi:glycopeptide antibiotics resistance protein
MRSKRIEDLMITVLGTMIGVVVMALGFGGYLKFSNADDD